jgi:tyrosine-protein kinase Etk/Wzc
MTENTSPPSAIAPVSVIAGSDPQSIPVDDDKISLLDLLQVVADNLRLLVLGPLVAGLLALGYSFTITPTFTATTKFMPPQQQQSGAAAMLAGLGALGGLASAAGIKNPADQYVTFLKSNSLQDALIDRFKLMERLETKSREDARSAVAGSVQIASGKDGLITIYASDRDPIFAAQLANAHVEELGRLLNHFAVTEAQQRRLFFEKQLAKAKDNLVKAEQSLASSGVNSSVLKSTGAAVAAVAQLKGQIAAQEIKLASMRGYLTESAPEFRQAQTELSAWRSQLGRSEKSDPAAGVNDSDYIAKLRDFKYYETLFELFTKQYEMARIDESREGAVIQVLDVAQPPERKSKPKKAQLAMLTTLVAGFTLLLFVFIGQAVRGAGNTPESAERLSRLRQALSKSLGRSSSLRAKRGNP